MRTVLLFIASSLIGLSAGLAEGVRVDISKIEQAENITTINLLITERSRDDLGQNIIKVEIDWEGVGGGLLQIRGPKGTMIALGILSESLSDPHKVFVTFFEVTDKNFSEQFDRGVVFGESELKALDHKSLQWIMDVINPVLVNHLNGSTIEVRQP